MAYTKLFESWTFSLPLPEPFAQALSDLGMNKTSSEERHISQHNEMQRGRQSTLHGPVLRALLSVAELLETDNDGAIGVQKNETGDRKSVV